MKYLVQIFKNTLSSARHKLQYRKPRYSHDSLVPRTNLIILQQIYSARYDLFLLPPAFILFCSDSVAQHRLTEYDRNTHRDTQEHKTITANKYHRLNPIPENIPMLFDSHNDPKMAEVPPRTIDLIGAVRVNAVSVDHVNFLCFHRWKSTHRWVNKTQHCCLCSFGYKATGSFWLQILIYIEPMLILIALSPHFVLLRFKPTQSQRKAIAYGGYGANLQFLLRSWRQLVTRLNWRSCVFVLGSPLCDSKV